MNICIGQRWKYITNDYFYIFELGENSFTIIYSGTLSHKKGHISNCSLKFMINHIKQFSFCHFLLPNQNKTNE